MSEICAVPECDKPHHASGFCCTHYAKWRRYGDPLKRLRRSGPQKRPREKRPLEERFWEKVQKTDDCWLWTGTKNRRGYGGFHVTTPSGRKTARAHRLSYEMHHRCSVPLGMEVMHSCDNPLCVNPAHLSVGTKADNMQDAARKGRVCTIGKSRKTHCPRGHELAGENLYRTRDGHRKCRECTRITQREAYARKCAKIAEAHDRDGRSNWGAVIAKEIRNARP